MLVCHRHRFRVATTHHVDKILLIDRVGPGLLVHGGLNPEENLGIVVNPSLCP